MCKCKQVVFLPPIPHFLGERKIQTGSLTNGEKTPAFPPLHTFIRSKARLTDEPQKPNGTFHTNFALIKLFGGDKPCVVSPVCKARSYCSSSMAFKPSPAGFYTQCVQEKLF